MASRTRRRFSATFSGASVEPGPQFSDSWIPLDTPPRRPKNPCAMPGRSLRALAFRINIHRLFFTSPSREGEFNSKPRWYRCRFWNDRDGFEQRAHLFRLRQAVKFNGHVLKVIAAELL